MYCYKGRWWHCQYIQSYGPIDFSLVFPALRIEYDNVYVFHDNIVQKGELGSCWRRHHTLFFLFAIHIHIIALRENESV